MIRLYSLIVGFILSFSVSNAQTFRNFIDINKDSKEDRIRGSIVSNDTIWFNSLSLDQDEVVFHLSCYTTSGEFINQVRVETSPQFGDNSLFKTGNRLFFTDTPVGTKTMRVREYESNTLELTSDYIHSFSSSTSLSTIDKIKDDLLFTINSTGHSLLYSLPLDNIESSGEVAELNDDSYNLYVSNTKTVNDTIELIATLTLFGDRLVSYRRYNKYLELIDETRIEKLAEPHNNPWIDSSPAFSNFLEDEKIYIELKTINTWPEQSRDFGYIIFDETGELEDYYVHHNPYLSTYLFKKSLLGRDGSIYLYGQVGISVSEEGPVSGAPLPFDRWNIYVPYIIKITDGEMEWERIYIRLDENGNNDFNWIQHLHETDDGFVALGIGNTDPDWFIEETGKYGDAFIMGIDKDGCFEQDDCGEGDWYQLTSTEDIRELDKPKIIIPNLVSTFIDLSHLDINKIEVYDMAGRKVYCASDKIIDINSLPAAAYLVVMHFDDYIETKRIVKH